MMSDSVCRGLLAHENSFNASASSVRGAAAETKDSHAKTATETALKIIISPIFIEAERQTGT